MAETTATTFSIRPAVLAFGARVAMLVLVALLLISNVRSPWPWLWWLGMLLAGTISLVGPQHRFITRAGRIAEVAIAAIGGAMINEATGATIPYLVAPVFAAGIFVGLGTVVALIAWGIVVMTVAGWSADVLDEPVYNLQALEWIFIAAGIGLLGSWIRSLSAARVVEPDYAQATRLLTQLRTIARQLPGTLDPGGIADRLLEELLALAPASRAAVFTASGGGRLEVLAQRGTERVAWETSIDADTPIADAWTSQQPQVATRSLVRAGRRNGVSALVLPLVTGVRTVGLVVMEVDQAGVYDRETVAQARNVAAEIALRLETALLFADVRSIATTEERQRLAREIHDGVAQELVMVGYGIDNAMAVLPKDSEAVEPLTALRAEVTRVITELRLSLFELRSDVDRLGGLGTAIAESARAIGNSAGLRVHLSLDESTARLPAAVEGELLRIAQEAITNARKHSQAHNLWVTCEVDPPYARIEIADDGRGITPREDADAGSSSYGMSIMAERAERIRALFSITPREGGGTVVSVELRGAAPARHGSVTTEQEVANSE